MGEFDLIRDYFSDIGSPREDVLVGVGDDGAVLAMDATKQLVSVMDTLVESIHFPRTCPGRSIGHRSLAVNLSDMAAMGATPRWASLSISLPTPNRAWLADFSAGFCELATTHNVQLVGGDTVSGPLVVTVHLCGTVDANQYILRSAAKPDDLIYVTGTLGDAAAGLRSMTRGSNQGWLVDQFQFPQPRVELGEQLGASCSAAIDISDGFGQDLQQLLTSSEVGALVDLDHVPISSELARHYDDNEARYLALSGGDDYELCVTVRPTKQSQFEQCCRDLECPVTQVGVIEAQHGLRFQLDGELTSVNVRGHDHFATDE